MDSLQIVSFFNVAIYLLFCVLFLSLFFYLVFYNSEGANLSTVAHSNSTSSSVNDALSSGNNEVTTTNPWSDTVRSSFDEQMYREIGIGLLSPLTVTVYKRWNESSYIVDAAACDGGGESFIGGSRSVESVNEVDGGVSDSGMIVGNSTFNASANFREIVPVDESTAISLMDRVFYDYPERLVIVQPQNWIVYSGNGITFYYLSNNVALSASRCDPSNSVTTIEFRLQTLSEAYNETTPPVDKSGRLKIACVNYTLDQLIRIFGSSADKTVYDFSDLFDKKKVANPPKLTIDEVLDILIRNSIV